MKTLATIDKYMRTPQVESKYYRSMLCLIDGAYEMNKSQFPYCNCNYLRPKNLKFELKEFKN